MRRFLRLTFLAALATALWLVVPHPAGAQAWTASTSTSTVETEWANTVKFEWTTTLTESALFDGEHCDGPNSTVAFDASTGDASTDATMELYFCDDSAGSGCVRSGLDTSEFAARPTNMSKRYFKVKPRSATAGGDTARVTVVCSSTNYRWNGSAWAIDKDRGGSGGRAEASRAAGTLYHFVFGNPGFVNLITACGGSWDACNADVLYIANGLTSGKTVYLESVYFAITEEVAQGGGLSTGNDKYYSLSIEVPATFSAVSAAWLNASGTKVDTGAVYPTPAHSGSIVWVGHQLTGALTCSVQSCTAEKTYQRVLGRQTDFVEINLHGLKVPVDSALRIRIVETDTPTGTNYLNVAGGAFVTIEDQ